MNRIQSMQQALQQLEWQVNSAANILRTVSHRIAVICLNVELFGVHVLLYNMLIIKKNVLMLRNATIGG